MSARHPAAVLWDLDGTLIDSEPYWMIEEQLLVADFGGRWSHQDALALVGRALLDSAAYIVAHSPVSLAPQSVVERLVAGVAGRVRDNAPWRPGALELLGELRASGVPTALVTMSHRPITDAVTHALAAALPGGGFDVIVSGEDVRQGKPHPEPYLTAAARLGLAADTCLAVEDSETGARSATAAGARTVVVPCVKPVPPLPGTVQLESLAGVRWADLRRL